MSRNIGEGGVTGARTFSQEKAKAKPPTDCLVAKTQVDLVRFLVPRKMLKV